MKTLVKHLLLMLLVLTITLSCDKQENITDNSTSGTISNYDYTVFDSIYFSSFQTVQFSIRSQNILSKCSVSRKGYFSSSLNEPMYLESTYWGIAKGVTMSDSTASIVNLTIDAFKNGKHVGTIRKCNDEYFLNQTTGSFIAMIYANKDLKLDGSCYSSLGSTMIYHLELKKGWNECGFNYEFGNQDEEYTLKLMVTNNIPQNLKWRFFPIKAN